MAYYFTAGTYQAAWSTTSTTTKLNDGSIGDTATFESATQTGTGSQTANLTMFYDNGSSGTLSSFSLEYFQTNVSLGNNASVTYILEGSTDHVSWTSINTATNASVIDSAWTAGSASVSPLAYQYYRLSIKATATVDTSIQLNCADWRLTLSSSSGSHKSLLLLGVG